MRSSEILRFNESALYLSRNHFDWQTALASAEPDAAVGIRHAAISGDAAYRIHVAAIPHHVGCHFHKVGDETYEIVQGMGTLHFGQVTSSNDAHSVNWETPFNVSAGDRFVIPEGYAHQLQRRGSEALSILFACPDSHLDDEGDRHHLANSPNL